jgi:hypothetical protein
MARYGENGFVQGTVCRVINDVKIIDELRDCEVVIVKSLHWSGSFGHEGYFVVKLGKNDQWWFAQPWMLKMSHLPVTLRNWATNKVLMLFEKNDDIIKTLAEEQMNGDFPYGQ